MRMEIYGSKGGLVYSLDVTPGVDELEVCFGYPYDRSLESTQSFPFPSVSSAIRCSPLQIFSTGAAMAWLPPFKTAAAFSMHWT